MQDINNYLDSELVRRTQRFRELKPMLAKSMPIEFFERISYATLDDGILTVFMDAPEWTSKMRFQGAEIIEVFASEGKVVKEFSAKTVPPPEPRPPVG